MKILITGQSGFIGSALWSFLHRQKGPYKFYGMTGGSSHLPGDNIFGCRLSDKAKLQELLVSIRPDCVIHLAGGRMPDDGETFESNFLGTKNLFEALKFLGLQKTRVIIPGTAGEYGEVKGPKVITETQVARPTNWYGLVKNTQVNLGLWYARQGFSVVIGRVFNVMGYGTPLELSMGRFANDIAALEKSPDKPVLQTGYLGGLRDFLDIEDVCAALLALAKKGKSGEIYHVCSGKTYSMEQLVRRLIKCSQVSHLTIQERKESPGPSCNAAGSNAKIKKATGWKPKVSLDESLKSLHVHGQVGNFIEKQRAAAGGLKQPILICIGAGETAFAMAEEFALHQLGRDRAAIDRHERAGGTRAEVMHHTRDQLLAGARFAADKYRGLAARHFGDGLPDQLHRRRVAEQAFARNTYLGFLRLAELKRSLHQAAQHGQIDRFGNKIESAVLQRLHRRIDIAIGGHHRHRQLRVMARDVGDQILPIAIGQPHIGETQIVVVLFQALMRLAHRGGGFNG